MSLYIGIMSGTSLDGVDAVLADIDQKSIKILHHCYQKFPDLLQQALQQLYTSAPDELHRISITEHLLTQQYTAITQKLLLQTGKQPTQISAIGTTGQTIRHNPNNDPCYSVQLLNAHSLSIQTNIAVISEFRQTDIALGGTGAPLSPAFHCWLCENMQLEVAGFLNLGGIANISMISQKNSTIQQFSGFDTGPANTMINRAMQTYFHKDYDTDGTVAQHGAVNAKLLQDLLTHPWLLQPPPKSTGPEMFNLDWVETFTQSLHINNEDLIATITEFSAVTISQSIEKFLPLLPPIIYLSGGGCFNHTLLQSLQTKFSDLGIQLKTSTALHIDPMCMEAACFAWYAFCNINHIPIDLTAITNTSNSGIYGSITDPMKWDMNRT